MRCSSALRDESGWKRLAAYLLQTGLHAPLEAIALRHTVTMREVYMDRRGAAVRAARLEIWWWMTTEGRRSTGEVEAMFHRSVGSVSKAMKDLRTHARLLGEEMAEARVGDVARDLSDRKRERLAMARVG